MTADQIKAKLRKASKKRLGIKGYARILRSTYTKPGTTEDLAARHKVNRNTMAYILRSMHRMGLIHRTGWVRPVPHSILVPVWRGGEAGDVSPIAQAKRHTSRKSRSAAITIGTISQVLREHGTASMSELTEEIGIHRETCIRLISILRTHGLVRIGAWAARGGRGGCPIPLYAWGLGPDVARPAPVGKSPDAARRHSATYYSRRRHLMMLKATAGLIAEQAA